MTKYTLPSVFAVERRFNVSSATFYQVTSKNGNVPVMVRNAGFNGANGANTEKGVSMPGTGHIARTTTQPDLKHTTVQISFTLSALPISDCISILYDATYKPTFETFLNLHIENPILLEELSNRYARQILNGSWLWRNKTNAGKVKISTYSNDDEIGSVDDVRKIYKNVIGFQSATDDEIALGKHILNNLLGRNNDAISVEAELTFAGNEAVEIFPSQEYVDGVKEKHLYVSTHYTKKDEDIVGYAALRDTKIANAIRIIDVEYSEDVNTKPISVEFYGANKETNEFLRKTKTSLFAYLQRIDDLNDDEARFVLACLIRGGVMSGDGKDKKDKAVAGKSKKNIE